MDKTAKLKTRIIVGIILLVLVAILCISVILI